MLIKFLRARGQMLHSDFATLPYVPMRPLRLTTVLLQLVILGAVFGLFPTVGSIRVVISARRRLLSYLRSEYVLISASYCLAGLLRLHLLSNPLWVRRRLLSTMCAKSYWCRMMLP